jgi:hypothetical protein
VLNLPIFYTNFALDHPIFYTNFALDLPIFCTNFALLGWSEGHLSDRLRFFQSSLLPASFRPKKQKDQVMAEKLLSDPLLLPSGLLSYDWVIF